MPYPIVIVTGDSIAQMSFKAGGYGSALIDMYQGNFDVLNRGMGGYNSTQLLQRFQEGLDVSAGADVRLILIHIGTNDCVERGFQKVSVEDYRDNLRKSVAHIRSTYPEAVTILLTPSTVDTETILGLEKGTGMPDQFMSYRTPERAREFAAACKAVGDEENLDCIDVFALHEGKSMSELFTDGLHYSAEGYKPICEALAKLIEGEYPQLIPSEFPRAFPMFATYGREGDQSATDYGRAIEEIGERMQAKAKKSAANGHANGFTAVEV